MSTINTINRVFQIDETVRVELPFGPVLLGHVFEDGVQVGQLWKVVGGNLEFVTADLLRSTAFEPETSLFRIMQSVSERGIV